MDTVINRLSDIEKAAVSVMDGAGERKKQMAREMEEKTAAFDARLEKENQDRISQIRGKNGRGITAGVKTAERGCQSSDGAAGRGL